MIPRLSQWIFFLGTLILLFIALCFIQRGIKAKMNRPAPKKEIVRQHPDVSVTTVNTSSYTSEITAYGSVSPHFELTLTARVSGQVEMVAENFESGRRLKKGSILAKLDESEYVAAVAAAEKNLGEARLALLEEQREAAQARLEWNASGLKGEPVSELVLHGPQLAAAEAAVAEAEADLASARKDLENTHITVPFDALIVQRNISPGSFLQAGTTVAVLYSVDRVETAISLSAGQWDMLPEIRQLNSGQWAVELYHTQTGKLWSGYVLRTKQHIDETSRQRDLILAVDEPLDLSSPLLPGTFIRANIKGRRMDNLWKLPSSALSQKGSVWYVNNDNTLASFTASPLFSDTDSIYVSPPENLAGKPNKILIHPLNSYLEGMVVNPVEETAHG